VRLDRGLKKIYPDMAFERYWREKPRQMLLEKIDLSPRDAFVRLRSLPMPFIFSGGGDGSSERYSFVSAGPVLTIKAGPNATEVSDGETRKIFNDPFTALSEVLARHSASAGIFPFNSGLFGYFSYDLNRVIEPRSASLKRYSSDDAVPDLLAGLYDPVFVYDRGKKQGHLISVSGNTERFNTFKALLNADAKPLGRVPPGSSFSANMTRQDYLAMIERAKDYISTGDIYQINLSQKLSVRWQGDPFTLFSKLSEDHPAPFSSYLDLGGFQIISNSPERLVRVSDATVETSPIKGTRPRGATPEQDRAMIDELKTSVKEQAEHVMIVDLERNDLGRVCVAGSVEVTEFERVHTYRHLHHMVSTVQGRVRPGLDSASVLKTVFPGGSITGAPKIRAMEIINELEPCPRGVYTGGIGWMGLNGDMDIAMAIRTAVYSNGLIGLHVGGGIVADSLPAEEYEETLLKARDFLVSLGALAENEAVKKAR